jgi:hypothetical protein
VECPSPPHHAFPGNIETPLLEGPEHDLVLAGMGWEASVMKCDDLGRSA